MFWLFFYREFHLETAQMHSRTIYLESHENSELYEVQSFVIVFCLLFALYKSSCYSGRMQMHDVIQVCLITKFENPFFNRKIGYVRVYFLPHLLLAPASFEWQLVMRIRK